MWDTETGKVVLTIEEGLMDEEGDSNFVSCCCFASNGRQFLSGSDDTTIKVSTHVFLRT